MRDVLRYLTDCRYIWMWGLLSGIAYAAVFGLYGIRWEAIWYPLLLAAAFGLFSWLSDSFVTERGTVSSSGWTRRMDRARIICPGQEA